MRRCKFVICIMCVRKKEREFSWSVKQRGTIVKVVLEVQIKWSKDFPIYGVRISDRCAAGVVPIDVTPDKTEKPPLTLESLSDEVTSFLQNTQNYWYVHVDSLLPPSLPGCYRSDVFGVYVTPIPTNYPRWINLESSMHWTERCRHGWRYYIWHLLNDESKLTLFVGYRHLISFLGHLFPAL